MLFKIGKFVRGYNLPKQRFSFQDKILSQSNSSTKSKPIKRFMCDLCIVSVSVNYLTSILVK